MVRKYAPYSRISAIRMARNMCLFIFMFMFIYHFVCREHESVFFFSLAVDGYVCTLLHLYGAVHIDRKTVI